MFYSCLMNIQGLAPDGSFSLPAQGESLIVNSFSRHQKSDSGISQKKKRQRKNSLTPSSHPKLYLTPIVYATHERAEHV